MNSRVLGGEGSAIMQICSQTGEEKSLKFSKPTFFYFINPQKAFAKKTLSNF